jgi:hypothetical protein
LNNGVNGGIMKRSIINIAIFLFVFTLACCIPATLDDDDPYIYQFDWGDTGDDNGLFDNPGGIFVYIPDESLYSPNKSSSGSVFVTDTYNHRVQVFDLDGNFITKWGKLGNGNGEFNNPGDIFVISDDLVTGRSSSSSVFVTDTYNSRIQVFDTQGNFKRSWGTEGSDIGEFNKPGGIFVLKDSSLSGRSSSSSVFVTDTYNSRIQVFDTQGNYITSFGELGTGAGQLDRPSSVFVIASDKATSRSSSSSVFVTDTYNSRIQVFDTQGNYITSFGEGTLDEPRGIYINNNDTVFITDSGNNQIHMFETDGEYIESFSTQGSDIGELSSPSDLYGTPDDSLYIVDTGNDRIQKFIKNDGFKYYISPTNNSTITAFEPIVITFNKPISTGSVSLNGTLLGDGYNTQWQTVRYMNDRLIINPQTYWNLASGKTINISYQGDSISLVYNTENAVYVSNTIGNDSYEGTRKNPKKTITSAINKLDGAGLNGKVYIAKDTYNVDYQSGTHIVIAEGISLFGAYEIGDWSRNLAANQSIINDTSTGGGSVGSPAAVIVANSGITNSTIIDGLIIKGSTSGGNYTSGIFTNNGSPTIRNSDINGGNGSTGSFGIYNKSSASLIYNNTIHGGSPTFASSNTHGIYNDNTNGVIIRNNTISGGNPSGGSSVVYAIFLTGTTNTSIDNNIIFTNGGFDRNGIWENDAITPLSVKNNDIFDCPDSLYWDDDGVPQQLTIITDVNNQITSASSNVSTVLTGGSFVNDTTDWHLSTTVGGVTNGGLNGSTEGWGFNTDKDGNSRTTSWSMGAYEKD